jgi:hypothetical protein
LKEEVRRYRLLSSIIERMEVLTIGRSVRRYKYTLRKTKDSLKNVQHLSYLVKSVSSMKEYQTLEVKRYLLWFTGAKHSWTYCW